MDLIWARLGQATLIPLGNAVYVDASFVLHHVSCSEMRYWKATDVPRHLSRGVLMHRFTAVSQCYLAGQAFLLQFSSLFKVTASETQPNEQQELPFYVVQCRDPKSSETSIVLLESPRRVVMHWSMRRGDFPTHILALGSFR